MGSAGRALRGLLAVLVALLVLAAVADGVGVGVVEDRVAEAIADRGGLAGVPDVSIEGWPFLTQVVAGNYDDVRIRLTAADLDQPAGTAADVRLRGVHVPLSEVIGDSITRIPVDRVDGTVTLSYELLSRELGTDTTLQPEGDGLRLTQTVHLQLLGFEEDVPLTAVGTVRVADGDDGQELVIDVSDAGAAGVDLPGRVVRAASELLDLRYPIELPFGLRVNDVRPADDGVRVTGGGTDVVLDGDV